jgi:uncharacterized protein (DUF488 family)
MKCIQNKEKYIFTFGYGNRKNYDILLDYINRHHITSIIDVRLTPRAWSRKWYKDQLENFCNSQGIRYLSVTSLGNISGKDNWIPPDPIAAKKSLEDLADIAKYENIVLICAEMSSESCHRVAVAQKIGELAGLQVKNLI